MAEQFANNASTTLNGAINDSVTSVVVTDGSVFPSSGNFRVVVGSEIMLCTARASNTLTVTRGVESTLTVAHANLAVIENVYTKGSFEQLITDYNQIGPHASRPATPKAGTLYQATDANLQWYYDGTNWSLLKPAYIPYAKRCDFSGWTNMNQNTETYNNVNGVLLITGATSNSNALRGFMKTAPTPPYTLNIVLGPGLYSKPSTGCYIGHRESSSGKMRMMFNVQNVLGLQGIEQWNNYNSFASNIAAGRYGSQAMPRWARIENDNTNWVYWTSFDGMNWSKMYSEAKNSGMTTAADQIVVSFFFGFDYDNSATPYMLLSEWEA